MSLSDTVKRDETDTCENDEKTELPQALFSWTVLLVRDDDLAEKSVTDYSAKDIEDARRGR